MLAYQNNGERYEDLSLNNLIPEANNHPSKRDVYQVELYNCIQPQLCSLEEGVHHVFHILFLDFSLGKQELPITN
jgi:hypothetical protein